MYIDAGFGVMHVAIGYPYSLSANGLLLPVKQYNTIRT
jgi:hypothetical protein